MKMKLINYYFTELLLLCLICSYNFTHTKHKSKYKSKFGFNSHKSTLRTKTHLSDPGFEGFFWKQLFEPGKNPENYIKNTDRFNQYEYLKVDGETIRFTPDKLQPNNVLNELSLHDIYDHDKDNVTEGKCCSRVTYFEYPDRVCFGRQCIIERMRRIQRPQTQAELDRDPLIAKYCLNIYIFQQASWRICHRDKDRILKLKNVITFGVMMTMPGANPTEILKKYIQHTSIMPLEAPDSWNWHNQDKWGGNCNSQFMQSPINIVAPVPGNAGQTSLDFKINYKFETHVPLIITMHGEEIVMKFTGYSGAFKIVYRQDGTMLSFTPTMITFRFPAEHLINGFRNDGEIVLICDEITPKNNKAYSVSNGMEFVIPIQFHPSAPDYKEFSVLNPEMWRHELEDDDDKVYQPRDPFTGKYSFFNMHSFMKKVMGLKSDFSMYLGSQTTPPCKDHVLQIVGNRPLMMGNCQFKNLRENALLSSKTKETHARELQNNDEAGENSVKNLKFAQFQYQSNLHELTPERKYFVLHYRKGGALLRKKIMLFSHGKNCGLVKTQQLPHYDRFR